MRARAVILLLALALLGCVACAAILSLDPLDVYQGQDDGGRDGGGGGSDLPDNPGGEGGTIGEVGQAPCNPNEAVTGSFFVSASPLRADGGVASDAGGAGSSSDPFTTISRALLAITLQSTPTVVILDEGTYTEAVSIDGLDKEVTIDGAWRFDPSMGTWKRDCDGVTREKTVIQSTSPIGMRVRNSKDIASRLNLSNLTVRSKPADESTSDKSSGSRYGMHIESAFVRLTSVLIDAQPASRGADAIAGVPGGNACPGPTLACADFVTAGVDGVNPPIATTFGRFEPVGYVPTDGVKGPQSGTNGTNGLKGGLGSTQTNCSTGCNEYCDQNQPNNLTGEPGQCGCGGLGGGPAGGGGGGGASIALYVVGTNVAVGVAKSELRAGNGGDGAAGGVGGKGGDGTPGAPGASKQCWQPRCCEMGNCPQNCGCYHEGNWNTGCFELPPTFVYAAGGLAGQPGARGGRGSNGGGGGGGPSFTYVVVGNGLVNIAESKRTFGTGGKGANGAPGGPTGEHP